MVSLMDHDMLEASTADGINTNTRDTATLVYPDIVVDTEPSFRRAATAAAIIFQLLCIALLLTLSGVLPQATDAARSSRDAYSILQYCHSAVWAIMIIIDFYLHREHNILSCSGYIHYYQLTKKLRKANVYIFSTGCAVLAVTAVVVDNYCPKRDACLLLSLRPVNYLQILLVIEAVFAVPFLFKYLVMTFGFHRNKFRQDAQHDELLLSFMHSQSTADDIGFRDGTLLEDIIEKQSDMISHLKKYNAFLSKKILNLSIELTMHRGHPVS